MGYHKSKQCFGQESLHGQLFEVKEYNHIRSAWAIVLEYHLPNVLQWGNHLYYSNSSINTTMILLPFSSPAQHPPTPVQIHGTVLQLNQILLLIHYCFGFPKHEKKKKMFSDMQTTHPLYSNGVN